MSKVNSGSMRSVRLDMKLRLIGPLLLTLLAWTPALAAQTESTQFDVIAADTLEIRTGRVNEDELHFRLTFEPTFYQGTLVDIRYAITYKELGTSFDVVWVPITNGQLMPIDGAREQWKGPLPGLRGIQYLFRLRLGAVAESAIVDLAIFSSHPEIDKAQQSLRGPTYTVIATGPNKEVGRSIIRLYQFVSGIQTAHQIGVRGLRAVAVPTLVHEIGSQFLAPIHDLVVDLFPITITVTDHLCGEETVYPAVRNSFVHKSTTIGCGRGVRVLVR